MQLKSKVTEVFDEKLKGSVLLQVVAAVVVSLQSGQYGIVGGWASPNELLLRSENTPLPTGPLSSDAASWMISIWSIGVFIGSVVFGFIANKFGRKWPLIFLSLPITVSWLMIAFAQDEYYLHVARLIQGVISGAIFSLCQFYFVEIADDSIRGALVSTVVVSGHIGVVISFILGAYSEYISYPILAIALTLLFDVIFIFFPETPIFLLKQNKIAEAEKSIRFYKNIRSPTFDKKLIDIEIDRLKKTLHEDEQQKTSKSSFKSIDLVTNPGRKAIIIGIVLAALNHITGSYALLSYTATIFKVSGSMISPNESALVVGVIQLIGTFVVPVCIERSGRKILYVVSTLGASIGFGILGLYMMLKSWSYEVDCMNWVPITSFSFIVFVQSLGVSTLSLTVTAEVMPENVKEFGITLSNIVLAVCGFLVLKFMPTLSDALGFHFTMYLFGVIGIPCGLFIIFYIPETKGRSYEEIMDLLK